MNILGDFHLHTYASGHAFSTLKDYIGRAVHLGLKYIGITDHSVMMPGSPHDYYFRCLDIIPRYIDGICIYRGIELNIYDDEGTCDYDSHYKLDYAIASIHDSMGKLNFTHDNYAQIYKKTLDRYPIIKILGHPDNPKFLPDFQELVKICKEREVLLEVNASSFTRARSGTRQYTIKMLKEAAALKLNIILSSDAHIEYELADFSLACEVIEQAGFPFELIINYNESMIKKYLGNFP